MPHQSGLIFLDHVSYSYPTDKGSKTILNDIDLQIHRGEWVAIAGANGSGKSTLAKVLASLYRPSSGTISMGGNERITVQMIFQNPDAQIVGDTVYEDVCFGMVNHGVEPEALYSRAADSLAKVGLLPFLHTPVSKLSGGQKQLLAVAGCLAVHSDILIFDEATSILDPMSREIIVKIAEQLHLEGKTIIWITQLLDELAYCDRVVAIEEGSILFDGSKQSFFYEKTERHRSICEQMGFALPYTVQVAYTLIHQGYKLKPFPVSPEELALAVGCLR